MIIIKIAYLNGKILEDTINFLNIKLTKLKGFGNFIKRIANYIKTRF